MTINIPPEQLEEFYANELWARPGQHILEIGQTGGGKTNGLYYIVDKIRYYSPGEKIVWFDSCKSEEIAILATRWSIRIYIPAGCTINIQEKPDNKLFINPVEIIYWKTPRQLWTAINDAPLEYVNVISLKYYATSGVGYVRALNEILDSAENSAGLLDMIRRRLIKGPMAIVIDEFQDVAPSKQYEFTKGHHAAGVKILMFIDQMRSRGIRLVAAAQGWPRILAGVRLQFQWNLARHRAEYSEVSMEDFNPLLAKLKSHQAIMFDPDGEWPFRSKLSLPFYGDGSSIWTIDYDGSLKSRRGQSELNGDSIFRDGYDVVTHEAT